jgi:hypothetical protein
LSALIVVSYGAGTDSTALLVEAIRRGIRPDLIVWADTGSEHPRTYAYLPIMRAFLADHGLELVTVRWTRKIGENAGRFIPIHEDCAENHTLPSAAFGFTGCSSKWKRQPVDEYIDAHPAVLAALSQGRTVERWVGYSADEEHRLSRHPARGPDQPYLWRSPLAEWGIDRIDARQIITCAGLPLPGKSACWLCPHSKPAEVQALRAEHPDLYERAVAIEAGADLGTVKGLGRSWRWADVPMALFPPRLADLEELPCSCATKRRRPERRLERRRAYQPRAARLDVWRWALGVVSAGEIARLAGVSAVTVRKMAARQRGSQARSLLT